MRTPGPRISLSLIVLPHLGDVQPASSTISAMLQQTISLFIVAATLFLMLRRPRNISEAWVAGAGGLLMLALGPLSLADARSVGRETADILLFLLGMMVLTTLVEQAGIFDFLAEGCAHLANGSGTLLFCGVFVLGAIVTAFLSL